MSWFFRKQILTVEAARSPAYLCERLKRSACRGVAMGFAIAFLGIRTAKPLGERMLAALVIAVVFFAIDGGLEYLIWSLRVRKWRKSGGEAIAPTDDAK